MPPDRVRILRRPLDLPGDGLAAIIGGWPGPALLESGRGFGDSGRWSILAAHPRIVFEATGDSWRIRPGTGTAETGRDEPLGRLARWMDRLGLGGFQEETPADPDLAPFRGGLIGYLGYDLAPQIERLPRRAPRTSRMPDVRFGLYDTAIVVDHLNDRAEFLAVDMLDEGLAALERRRDGWLRALKASPHRPGIAWLGPPQSNLSKAQYLAAAERVLGYIRAGDVFQVNLAQRFSSRDVVGPASRPDPLSLYLRLRARSPAPYGAFLHWNDLAIVGASPELFFETSGRRIVTRPIKGTRARGESPELDAGLAAELLASPKDRAELTMIVDLERNDLGRVCEYGSIRVLDPLALVTFPHVHHLVATVEGRLRDGTGPVDVIRALFPGGSITGAPKIRAMEIIDELEPCRRGPYTGAVGYFGLGGTSGFNIAIRTLLVEGETAHYSVGGGIVADSDPEAEYQETLVKGTALREVLEGRADDDRGRG